MKKVVENNKEKSLYFKNDEIINKLLFGINCILYFVIMMFLKYSTSSKKELEFAFILAIPCIMIFIYSLKDNKRKKYFYYYLIAYIIALIGFTFSDNRMNSATISGVIIRNNNFVPFSSVKELLTSPYGIKFGLYNIIGNLLMLTPLAIILPNIGKIFKKTIYYALIIFLISLCIEILQAIFNIGSFDIDDIILNFIGAFLVYIVINKCKFLNNLVENIFINCYCDKRIINTLYYILLFMSILVTMFSVYIIVSEIKSNIVHLDHLTCKSQEDTFITINGNYRYYSKCDYGTGEDILVGNVAYSLERFLSMNNNFEKYKDKLNLYQKEIITNVEVSYSKENVPKLMYTSDDGNEKIYYVGIDSIICQYDNKEEDYLVLNQNKNGDFNVSLALLEMKEMDRNDKENYIMTVSESKYFKVISCSYDVLNPSSVNSYFVPKDYKYPKDFCLSIVK